MITVRVTHNLLTVTVSVILKLYIFTLSPMFFFVVVVVVTFYTIVSCISLNYYIFASVFF